MPWTTEQCMFIVEIYFRQKSIHTTQLQFKKQFWCREFPVHSMIYRWVNKFRTHRTVHNLSRKDTNRQSHSGRLKLSTTPHNDAAVRDSCRPQPKQVCVSAQSGAWNQLGIRAENLIADLHMYPCRIQIKQKLTPDKMRKRVITHQWLYDKIDAVPDFLDNVWFSDEAHFLVLGHMNSKNNIFWGSTPLSTVWKGHDPLWSALFGFPSPNMASLDHSGSRTTMSSLRQSIPSDMSRCMVSSGQHLVAGEGLSVSSSGSSRMVPPPTPQTNH